LFIGSILVYVPDRVWLGVTAKAIAWSRLKACVDARRTPSERKHLSIDAKV
jgi:hypothetical protein